MEKLYRRNAPEEASPKNYGPNSLLNLMVKVTERIVLVGVQKKALPDESSRIRNYASASNTLRETYP